MMDSHLKQRYDNPLVDGVRRHYRQIHAQHHQEWVVSFRVIRRKRHFMTHACVVVLRHPILRHYLCGLNDEWLVRNIEMVSQAELSARGHLCRSVKRLKQLYSDVSDRCSPIASVYERDRVG